MPSKRTCAIVGFAGVLVVSAIGLFGLVINLQALVADPARGIVPVSMVFVSALLLLPGIYASHLYSKNRDFDETFSEIYKMISPA